LFSKENFVSFLPAAFCPKNDGLSDSGGCSQSPQPPGSYAYEGLSTGNEINIFYTLHTHWMCQWVIHELVL